MAEDYVLKIILIGDCGVGKSCLMSRLVEGRMVPEMHVPTIGVDFGVFRLSSHCGHSIKCHIWDTAGHERFDAITRSYYKGACGAVMMFDASSVHSFERIRRWRRLVEAECAPGTAMVLIANKIDKKREVTYDMAHAYAAKHSMSYIEMSLVSGVGVTDVMPTVVEQVMLRIIRPGLTHAGVVDKQKRTRAMFNSPVENPGCCVVS